MKLNTHQIESAHRAISKVKSIDKDIEWLGRDAPDKVADHGKSVRTYLGQNRMGHFTDDHLGEVVLCAVINALLDMRTEAISSAGDLVEFPDAPCPRQGVQPQS